MSRAIPKWEPVEGDLATPLGFRAAAVAAGLKKTRGALDLALIFSDSPATTAAGVFTTNLVAAAPVLLSRKNLVESRGRCRAVVVNSGNANACTGRQGMHAAEETARVAGDLLGIEPSQVLVASTGVIGIALNVDLILQQLPHLKEKLSKENANAVANAIMTTDTVPKSCVVRSEIKGRAVHIAGIAKGAGMIHPHMATMLSFITTDAAMGERMLHNLLIGAAEDSFNRVTVDGDTSTNDTAVALASGLSEITVIPGNDSRAWFAEGLNLLCQTLARMIARDGEGASKLVTVEVAGARTPLDADRVARSIANSPLVKTALAGSDPNWGRIICAAGYSGAKFDPNKIDVTVNSMPLCRKGLDAGFDEAAAHREIDQKEIVLRIDLHAGRATARVWTCDFTRDYIDINSSYRS
ncbi:MAG: bifunctional glutamate N-acetyltransferase/amino-acid acetyltransferase ArgJ [Acidobacteriota bacterium]|nr:bifunctional glutamate N-acetyltransferase/amino-acid acetyltransferase ArgJ [Acidobacteriota bacterium]